MVWLSEAKKCFNVNVPGFRVFYNPSKRGSHRGGIMLLIKDKVLEFVKCIDMDTEGQIWIILSFLVTYKFGGVYRDIKSFQYFFCKSSAYSRMVILLRYTFILWLNGLETNSKLSL